MKLAIWLSKNDIKRANFADTVGLSRSYLTELCQGKRSPSLEIIRAIDEATNGAVQARDFYEEAAV